MKQTSLNNQQSKDGRPENHSEKSLNDTAQPFEPNEVLIACRQREDASRLIETIGSGLRMSINEKSEATKILRA